jgi:glycosyltransferase involved in cell wall biosynthesis
MHIAEEIARRFQLQEEYLGTEKPINTVTPHVSVTIVTYNHGRFIEQCIESALRQSTSFPCEILIGEDGSTDGTREICVRYAERYPDVIRLFLRDRAVSIFHDGTRDRILNGHFTRMAARGRYLAFLEGDDYWTSATKVQRQAEYLDAHPESWGCFTNAEVVDQLGGTPTRLHYPDGSRRLPVFEPVPLRTDLPSMPDLIMQRRILIMTWMIRRALLQGLPPWYYEIPYCDRAVATLAREKGLVKYMPEVTAIYRLHEGGIWAGSNDFSAKYETSISIFRRINEHLRFQYDPYVSVRIAELYAVIAKRFAQQRNAEMAGRYQILTREALARVQALPRS